MTTPAPCKPGIRTLCACLSPFRTNRDHALPANWRTVVIAADRHLLIPAFWIALGNKGLRLLLPESQRDHLQAAYVANRDRNSRILHQIGELARCLNANGICPVLLNGTAVLAAGWYGDPGVGSITRIDLLVPSNALPTALACLKYSGYRSAGIQSIDRDSPELSVVHQLQLRSPALPVANLALHSYLGNERFRPASRGDVVPRQAGDPQRLDDSNVDIAILPVGDQLKLGILRTLASPPVRHRRYLDLNRLHLFIQLVYRFHDTVDWSRLARSLADAGWGPHYRAYRHVANALFGPVPPLNAAFEGQPPRWDERLSAT